MPIKFLTGTDSDAINRQIQFARLEVGDIDFHQISGWSPTALAIVQQRPMLSPYRLIVIDCPKIQHCLDIPDTTNRVLVVLPSIDKRTKAGKALLKGGYEIETYNVPTDPVDYVKWACPVGITDEAAKVIADYYAVDSGRIQSEVNTLSLVYEIIDYPAVSHLARRTTNIYGLIDSLLIGDIARLLLTYRELEEPDARLLGLMIYQTYNYLSIVANCPAVSGYQLNRTRPHALRHSLRTLLHVQDQLINYQLTYSNDPGGLESVLAALCMQIATERHAERIKYSPLKGSQ